MSDETVKLELIPKDPDMHDVLDIMNELRGRKIIQVSTSWVDEVDRSEEIRLLLDNGKEVTIFSAPLCWYKGDQLMRIVHGMTKNTEEFAATAERVPPTGLIAFSNELDANLMAEWEEMVGDKKEWAEFLKNIPKFENSKKGPRKIKMSDKTMKAMEQQLAAFEKKFGRKPGPKDPVFFDPEKDIPSPMSEEKISRKMIDLLKKAVPQRPELIYAYKKVGILVSEQNQHLISKEDLKAWDNAVKEYLKLAKKGQAPEL